MCDVMKIRLNRGMKGEVGKKTPKKELDILSFQTYFYDVTQATFQRFIITVQVYICVPARHQESVCVETEAHCNKTRDIKNATL